MLNPENEMSDVVKRVTMDCDNERLRSMCSLLNSFNYAVQIQSGRKNWEPTDFRLFAIALCAMDQIGIAENVVKERESVILAKVESEISGMSNATRMMKGMQ